MRKAISKHISMTIIFSFMIGGQLAHAEESWNIIFPDTEGQSRETSASLFNSAAMVFTGLGNVELKLYQKAKDDFDNASNMMVNAAGSLEELAKNDVAKLPLNLKNLDEGEIKSLVDWFGSKMNMEETPDSLKSMTIGEMLNHAASEARRIANSLRESYGNVSGGDPDRARKVIDDLWWFFYEGTIATKAFRQ